MDATYVFRANAEWTSDAHGEVQADPPVGKIAFSAPPEFHGPPGFWSPEHFLLAAAAACFVTTFRAIAGLSRFEFASLHVGAEGTVEKAEGGYQFTRLLVKPRLHLRDAADRERALRLLHKAEQACLISRSLKCHVEMESVISADAESPRSPEAELVCSGA